MNMRSKPNTNQKPAHNSFICGGWLNASVAAGITIILSACSSMRTVDAPTNVSQSGRAYAGLHYFLPRGIIDIVGTVDADGKAYTVTIARHNEADRRQRYLLVQNNSILHEDVTDLKVNDKGLLNEDLALTSESKTAQIIYNVTDTAINIAKIYAKTSGASPMTAYGLAAEPTAPINLKSFKVSFDPLKDEEITDAENTVRDAGFDLRVERRKSTTSSLELKGGPENSHDASTTARDSLPISEDPLLKGNGPSRAGVYYRPLTTVKVKLHIRQNVKNKDEIGELAINQNVPIPDPSALAIYSLYRGTLIKKETTLTFADGEPRTMHHKKPSELLAASEIPLTISSHVLAALPDLGSLVYKPKSGPNAKIEADTARLNAQTAAINARTDALKANQAAEDALKKQQAGSSSGAGAGNVATNGAAMTAATIVESNHKADMEKTDAAIAGLRALIDKLPKGPATMDHAHSPSDGTNPGDTSAPTSTQHN